MKTSTKIPVRIALSLFVGAFALILNLSGQTTVAAQTPSAVPIDVEIPIAPTPVRANGRTHLVYELHITNFDRRARAVNLSSIEVLGDGQNPRPLAHYTDRELTDSIYRPGAPQDLPDKRRIAGGMRAVVFMFMTLDANAPVPSALHHRFALTVESVQGERTVEGANVRVRDDAPLILGAPLRGDGWLAGNALANNNEHRRAINIVKGRATISQRFAIDFIKFGRDGLGSGDEARNASYYGYGAEVLAVADATVAAVKDGIPENTAGTVLPASMTLETQGGNYVVLDLGGSRYASYGHLQPGSLRVRVADRVRRGQVIALLGNSGNSDAPHLHFHISDANIPSGIGAIAASEGQPFVFDSFEVQGQGHINDEGATWTPFPKGRVEQRQREIPLDGAVVRFP